MGVVCAATGVPATVVPRKRLVGCHAAVSQFADFVRLAGEVGAPLVSVAWQPNGIFRTGRGPGRNTRGGTAFFADLYEIESLPTDGTIPK